MGVSGRLNVRHIQPDSAIKPYLCPGCGGVISVGRFHLVVIPEDEPDLRRHWHHGCWYKELRRLLGRSPLSGNSTVPLDANSPFADHDGDEIYPPHPE